MKVAVLEPHGFCAGVTAALRKALSMSSEPGGRGGRMYCLHELVHNEAVVGELRERGMRFVESLDEVPEGATVLFSAHGVPPHVRAQAAARGLKVIDATCPFVARAHRQVREFAARGVPVAVVGDAGHVEVVGLVGEYKGLKGAKDIKDLKDIKDFKDSKDLKDIKDFKDSKDFKDIKDFKDSKDIKDLKDIKDFKDSKDFKDIKDIKDFKDFKDIKGLNIIRDARDVAVLPFPSDGPVGVVCQTTLSSGAVQNVLSALRARYPRLVESPAAETCTATRDRQAAVRAFVQAGDPVATGVLVVGSAASANTARLVEIAREAGATAWRVDRPEELSKHDISGLDRLGLTAGASTPEVLVEAVRAALTAR